MNKFQPLLQAQDVFTVSASKLRTIIREYRKYLGEQGVEPASNGEALQRKLDSNLEVLREFLIEAGVIATNESDSLDNKPYVSTTNLLSYATDNFNKIEEACENAPTVTASGLKKLLSEINAVEAELDTLQPSQLIHTHLFMSPVVKETGTLLKQDVFCNANGMIRIRAVAPANLLCKHNVALFNIIKQVCAEELTAYLPEALPESASDNERKEHAAYSLKRLQDAISQFIWQASSSRFGGADPDNIEEHVASYPIDLVSCVQRRLPFSNPDLKHSNKHMYKSFEELAPKNLFQYDNNEISAKSQPVICYHKVMNWDTNPYSGELFKHVLKQTLHTDEATNSVLDFCALRAFSARAGKVKPYFHLIGSVDTGKSLIAQVIVSALTGLPKSQYGAYVSTSQLKGKESNEEKYHVRNKPFEIAEDIQRPARIDQRINLTSEVKTITKTLAPIQFRSIYGESAYLLVDTFLMVSSNMPLFVETEVDDRLDNLIGVHLPARNTTKDQLWDSYMWTAPTGEVLDAVAFFTEHEPKKGFHKALYQMLWEHFLNMDVKDSNRIGLEPLVDASYRSGLSTYGTRQDSASLLTLHRYFAMLYLADKIGLGTYRQPVSVLSEPVLRLIDREIAPMSSYSSGVIKLINCEDSSEKPLELPRPPYPIGWLDKPKMKYFTQILVAEMLGINRMTSESIIRQFLSELRYSNTSVSKQKPNMRFPIGYRESNQEKILERFSYYDFPQDIGERCFKYLEKKHVESINTLEQIVKSMAGLEILDDDDTTTPEANRDEWIAENMKLRHAKQTELTDEFLL